MNEIITKFDLINKKIDNIKKNNTKSIKFIKAENTRHDFVVWQALREGDEPIAETKKRFFLNLPKATGDLRIIQLSLLVLLKKIDEVCRKNEIPYFLAAGTLFGAVRHKGFIPWDDDVDVFMFHDDVDRLFEVMEDEKDFEIVNWISIDIERLNKMYNRMVRVTYKNSKLEGRRNILDIFVLDYAADTSQKTWKAYLDIRNLIFKEQQQLREKGIRDEETLMTLHKKYVPIFQKAVNPENTKNAVIWHFDNFTHASKFIVEAEMIFPLREVEFEGHLFMVPNRAEDFIRWRYGNIFSLPMDIGVLSRHGIYEPKEINILKELLNKYGQEC